MTDTNRTDVDRMVEAAAFRLCNNRRQIPQSFSCNGCKQDIAAIDLAAILAAGEWAKRSLPVNHGARIAWILAVENLVEPR